jgi:heme exporter protein D
MTDWQAFVHMGGYGAYVWSSYGLSALVLVLNVWLPGRAERAALSRLARRAHEGRDDEAENEA